MNINVTKRNGKVVPYEAEKINESVEWACEGLDTVSASNVALQAQYHLYDKIPTSQIQKALVDAAVDLTTLDNPDYAIVAGRLLISDIRKHVYGQFEPIDFYQHIYENVSLGKYDKDIMVKYTKEEIEELEKHIDHDRDLDLTHASVMTWEKKYLVKNKVTGTIYESPQYALMLIGMCLHEDEEQERIKKVVDFYHAVSLQKLSLPSPIMAGVRTPTRQFSSCTLIDAGDNLDSINAAGNAIVKYASKRAGIGINGGRLRALGSPIRGGEVSHTGAINFYKKWQGDLHSCSQGGLRTTAATLFYPWWHLEVESLLVLKNNKGTESNRVRHLDYGIQLNRLFYKRYMEGKDLSLFSTSDVGNLYELFFKDQDEFEKMYEALENDNRIRRKTIKAVDLMNLLANERAATGRIYIHNVDHTNDYGAFDKSKAPVYMSNLCVEITLPTTPLQNINDGADTDAEIALCTLAAYNLGNIESLDELEELALIAIRALDNLLNYQDYPVAAAEKNKLRRTLGVGVINYSYYLAKNHVKLSDGSANNLTHRTFEAIQYYSIKASALLAKERGACEWFGDTKYSQGIMPIDNYKADVDNLHTEQLHCDWDALRELVAEYGMRNSTLTALMPAETSAIISNATNGIEPQRAPLAVKASKDGSFKIIVPDYQNLKDWYEFAWDLPNNIGYLSNVAIMGKFIDMAASLNTNYDPKKYADKKVPMKEIIRDIFFVYKHGLKTMYYHNTRDGRGEDEEDSDDGCSSGACKI